MYVRLLISKSDKGEIHAFEEDYKYRTAFRISFYDQNLHLVDLLYRNQMLMIFV